LWIDRYRVERVLLLQQATLWPAFILLRFRDEKTGKTQVFTLLQDSLEADRQRRLRVYLRHMSVPTIVRHRHNSSRRLVGCR
jgi:hypothetical protein